MNILNIKSTILIRTVIFSFVICLCGVAKSQSINIDGNGDAINTQNGSTNLLNWSGNIITFSTEGKGQVLNFNGTDGITGGIVSNRNAKNKYTIGIRNWNSEYTFLSYHNLFTAIGTGANDIMYLNNDGRVAIGKGDLNSLRALLKEDDGTPISADSYRLFVEKGILTEKCKVAVAGEEHWADYVFEEDYEMMELEELEDYVSENKHLPNVPSAEEVVANGIDVATMDAKLLEKIEEAYLYIIDLNKKVDALATENEGLKTSLQSLSTSNQ